MKNQEDICPAEVLTTGDSDAYETESEPGSTYEPSDDGFDLNRTHVSASDYSSDAESERNNMALDSSEEGGLWFKKSRNYYYALKVEQF